MLNQIKLQIFFILFFFTRDIKYLYKYISLSNNKKYIEILKKKLIEIKKSPSDYINNIYPKFNSIERYAIFGALKKIEKKGIPKGISLKNRNLSFFSHNLELLAFNLSLSIIYSYQGAICKNYFYYDEFDLARNILRPLNKNDFRILNIELEKINNNFKNIKIINLNYFPKKFINKKIKEKLKIVSVKDICAYSQIISIKKVSLYKEIQHKISNKENLKERYLSNLDFAKKIINLISKKDYWILHNSNLSKNGVLQTLIDLSECNYTSHESTTHHSVVSSSNNPDTFKFCYLKNKIILTYDFSDEIRYYLNQNNSKQERRGKEIIEQNFKNNYSLKDENFIKDKFSFLKRIDKSKIFILLASVLRESKFLVSTTHTIFDDYKDYLVKTINHFNNSDCKLLIKVHPDELNKFYNFNDTHEKILKNLNLKNISLISEKNISSYSLTNLSNNFIVYNTDMAAEILFKDKNVITCANSKYKAFNLTFFPKTQNEYFETLDKLSKNQITKKSEFFNVSKKRCSLFWYFYINEMFKDMYFSYGNSLNELNKNFNKIFDNVNKNENFKNILNIVK